MHFSLLSSLFKSGVGEKSRCDSSGVKVLLGNGPCGPAFPFVITVNGVNCREGFVHCAEGVEAFARRKNVAESRILRNDRFSAGKIADVPLTEPSAAKANILILGDCELRA